MLATRCPNCSTVFRLKPAQLEVSGGQVRCGHCDMLFDAIQNRTQAPDAEPTAGNSPHVSALEARRSLLARLNARTEPGGVIVAEALNALPDRRFAPELSLASSNRQQPSAATKPKAATNAKKPATAGNKPGQPPAATKPQPSERRFVRALIGPFVVLLALACALQYAWWQREYIRVSWPPSEIAFQTFCRLTGCTISPAHDIDLLQIASMSLRQIDDPRHLALQVVIRNRSAIPQAYPSVELTLTDAHNQASIRKVITPAQYLGADTAIDTGIGQHAERTLQMRVDTTTVPANNYRVTIFYP